MKKYILSAILLGVLSGMSSCSDWLDVNHNPNAAEKVEPGYLFNYVAVAWSGTRTSGDFYIPISQSLQIQADGGDSYGGWAEGNYVISPYSVGNVWKGYYNSSANNLKLAIKMAKEASVVNNNAIAQCNVIFAENMYEATMMWGDVPFTEAWNENIRYPKFDSQEVVLNGIIDVFDNALSTMDPSLPSTITEYDVYYGGDMAKWQKLTRSLKFRTLMVMVDKDPSKAEMIGKMLTEGGMIDSAAGNMEFKYSTNSGNENPKYKILEKYFNGQNQAFFAHNNVLKPMQDLNDPRIPVFFEPGHDGVFRGLNTRQAAEEDKDKNLLSSVIGKSLYRKDIPDLLYSYQEQLFLEAEAYLRGLGVAKDAVKANELYRKAVKEACLYYGVEASAAEKYANSLADLSTVDEQTALKNLHMQQWIDLMDRPFEAFVQWRRSGSEGNEYPALEVPATAITKDLIRRWDYSPEEMTANPNSPKSNPNLWDKMWFDL